MEWSALLCIKLALSGIWSKLLWGCIKLNPKLVSHDNITLSSWLVSLNVTCFKLLVSGCTAYKLQDSIILILSVVQVPISLLLGASSCNMGHHKINLYALAGKILCQCRCLFLSLNTGSSFDLVLACKLHFYKMLWCRCLSLIRLDFQLQAERFITWTEIFSVAAYRILCTNWANLQLMCHGWSWFQGAFVFMSNLLVVQATEMTKFMAILALVFAHWTSKILSMSESPQSLHLSWFACAQWLLYLLCNIACNYPLGNIACLYLALIWNASFVFFQIYWVVILCAGVTSNVFGLLVGHLQLV